MRALTLLLLCVAAVPRMLWGSEDALDPVFANIPFDEWMRGGQQTPFRWSVHVPGADLSPFQRLLTHVDVLIDGRDLEARRDKGEFVFFIQVTDNSGSRYQGHGTIDLSKLAENVENANITFTQPLFVLPGDYRVDVAVLATGTKEHAVAHESFHVLPFKNDPLPESWRNLPAVAFIAQGDPPEAWFLPKTTGRLYLPAAPPVPTRVEVIFNLAPPQQAPGSRRPESRNLATLLPVLRVLSDIRLPGSSVLDISVLDLARRHVAFRQNNARELDWPALNTGLAEGESATIDIRSLEHRHETAAYFVDQVRRRIDSSAPGPQRVVVIVLSPPMTFESGENLQPINVESPGDAHVLFVRYAQPIAVRRHLMNPSMRGGPMRRGYPRGGVPEFEAVQIDQLASTLKPLRPRIFDVRTPEQFRKALARILTAISQ